MKLRIGMLIIGIGLLWLGIDRWIDFQNADYIQTTLRGGHTIERDANFIDYIKMLPAIVVGVVLVIGGISTQAFNKIWLGEKDKDGTS